MDYAQKKGEILKSTPDLWPKTQASQSTSDQDKESLPLLIKKQDSQDDTKSIRLPKALFGSGSQMTNSDSDDEKPIILPNSLFPDKSDGTRSDDDAPNYLSL